jgi:hypothetical protein
MALPRLAAFEDQAAALSPGFRRTRRSRRPAGIGPRANQPPMPATRALPPMMAMRPRVCIVMFMRCRSFSGIGAPFSSCRGTASTVMASATTS